MKLNASPPISPYQPIAKGTNSLVKPSKGTKFKTLVSNPSFREPSAGDACWETTGDDDGDLGESLYILHLQCLAVFYPIYCFVTRTEQ